MKVSIENAIEELPQMFNFNTKHITESQAKLFREKADNTYPYSMIICFIC